MGSIIESTNTFDVVIVGAGPAGLIVAAWMAQTGVKTLLIDKNRHPPQAGHADGIESRTFEILESFGIVDQLWKDANKTVEVALWHDRKEGVLCRDHIRPNSHPGLSQFQEATLAQGRIEQALLEFISRFPNITIQRETVPVALSLNLDEKRAGDDPFVWLDLEDAQDHPKYSYSEKSNNEAHLNRIKTAQAQYLIGCDGAHSWVRKTLGLSFEGDSTEESWGVIDCVPDTNFPDIRRRCIIQTCNGSIMIIPRERNMIRVYVQLASTFTGNKDSIPKKYYLDEVSKILSPYYFHAEVVEWASTYSIRQKLCSNFGLHNRIFLAGDAVHTHSPKAGQGMNVSMQDAFNLGWKLAHVIHGLCSPRLLETYHRERFPVAQKLLSFDKRIYGAISSRDGKQDALTAVLDQENSSASGISVTYEENPIVWRQPSSNNLSSITIGSRLMNEQVLSQGDSRPWLIHQLLSSQGQWTLLVFGGNIAEQAQLDRVKCFASLAASKKSILELMCKRKSRYPVGSIEIFLIHSAARHEVDQLSLPSIFVPHDLRLGYDYNRVFADNASCHGTGGVAYKNYGIGEAGCLVLLRPDQHVAFIGDLEGVDRLENFFSQYACTL